MVPEERERRGATELVSYAAAPVVAERRDVMLCGREVATRMCDDLQAR